MTKSDVTHVKEPIIAWRKWHFYGHLPNGHRGRGGSVALLGDKNLRPWDRGVNVAECDPINSYLDYAPASSCDAAEVPVKEHTCGLYGINDIRKTLSHYAAAAYANGNLLIGRAKMWGKVIEHEHGWRAKFVQPLEVVRLWDPVRHEEKAFQKMADWHGIEIVNPGDSRFTLLEQRCLADMQGYAHGGLYRGSRLGYDQKYFPWEIYIKTMPEDFTGRSVQRGDW